MAGLRMTVGVLAVPAAHALTPCRIHYRGRTGMSGRRALVAGNSDLRDGIGLRGWRATAGFRPGPALGPSSLRWVRSLLPGEESTAWWVWSDLLPCRDP